MSQNFKRVKLACYATNASMSVVANLSPLLFITFRSIYGFSYSMLGFLVFINFCTQLAIDLVFSFFSHKFNIPRTVAVTPVLTAAGLLIYALFPLISPENAYLGLVIGTVIFSVSGGLNEVLMSPIVAAIPADDPDREMSKLHSVYAWGVVFVVIISTLFLLIFGNAYWYILALIFALIPLCAAFLFRIRDIPPIAVPEKISGATGLLKSRGLFLCVMAIFLGGASECVMAQWSSGYLEQALGIPKLYGDVFGVALFSMMLGLGRSLYSRLGHNIGAVIFAGGTGAAVCYIAAALSPSPVIGLIACVLTGFCTSMLWPGNLIVASERFPTGGLFIYALMAAGGDLGASVGPQLVGVLTDICAASPQIAEAAQTFGILPEQLSMKLGVLTAALFPIASIPVYWSIWKKGKTEV